MRVKVASAVTNRRRDPVWVIARGGTTQRHRDGLTEGRVEAPGEVRRRGDTAAVVDDAGMRESDGRDVVPTRAAVGRDGPRAALQQVHDAAQRPVAELCAADGADQISVSKEPGLDGRRAEV